MQDLWTLFTVHYDIVSDSSPCLDEVCSANSTLLGYLITDEDDPILGNKAVCVLCPRAFSISNHRGISCDSLGNIVSTKMDVLGSTILHEMMHWDYFITSVTDGKPLVDWDQIRNGLSRPTGTIHTMPCWSTRSLPNQRSQEPATSPNPVWNPDNYVWFAMEVWWRKTCPHIDFGAALPGSPNARHPI